MSTLFQEVLIIWLVFSGAYQTLNWICDFVVWVSRAKNVKKYPVSCSIYKVDEEYDKLINKILNEGILTGLDNYRVHFTYNGKKYGIWIKNKDGAYGSVLYEMKSDSILIDNRAPKKETLYKLYEKELLATKKNSTKYKEDKLIAQLLSDSEA